MKIQTEAMDRLNYALRSTGDQMIHLVITYDKQFNFKILKKAARMILDVEPVLGSLFIEHPKKPFWKKCANYTNMDYCEMYESNDVDRDILDYLKKDYNPLKELPLQLAVFRAQQQDTLCIKVSHHGLDGGGIFDYFNLLKSIYHELLKDENFTHPINQNGSRSLKQVLKKYNILQRIYVFFRNMSPKPNWAFPWHDTKRTQKNMIIKRFEEELFDKLKKYSRKKNVTLNDILLTAFYRAMFEIAKPPFNKKMVSVVTVNLRYMMKGKDAEAICNLSSSIYAHVPRMKDETFEETLEFIHDQMNDLKTHLPGIGSAFFIHNFFGKLKFSRILKAIKDRIQKDIELKRTHPVFTNVGLVTAEQLKFGTLNAIDSHLATPIMFAPGFIFGIMTFENKMSVSIGFCEGSYKKELIDELISRFESELKEIVH